MLNKSCKYKGESPLFDCLKYQHGLKLPSKSRRIFPVGSVKEKAGFRIVT